jgi:hypothetical protein
LVPFFGTAGFLVVEALRDAVLMVNVLGAVDFAAGAFGAFVATVSFCAAVSVEAFDAAVFAAEDFVVAVLADVEALDTELFKGAVFEAVFGAAGLGADFGAAGLTVGFGADSSSVFFGLPRRTGAFKMLDFGGDSGWSPFACARCALVSTIL